MEGNGQEDKMPRDRQEMFRQLHAARNVSKDDNHFGVYKRPTKAEVLKEGGSA